MAAIFDFLFEREIFLHLLNLSISAGFLVVAVLFLRLILKKAPKWIHCLLWALVGVRLVFPFSIESIFSLIPSAETVPPEIIYEETPQIQSGISFVNSSVNPFLSESLAPSDVAASINPMQVVLAVLTAVWLAGLVLMIGYMVFGYFCLRHRLCTAVRLRENIYQSETVDSPFILGVLRPKIYLPYYMEEADAEYVIAHERAHLKRGDHFIKPFAFLVLAVYWFNPILWVAYIFLCRDIELACDEKVIRLLGETERKEYSYSLLKCSIHRKTILSCPLAFGEVGVKERVKNVMHYKKPAFWILILAIVAVIVTAVCFLTNPKTDEENTNEEITLPSYFRAVESCGSNGLVSASLSEYYDLPYYYIDKNLYLYEKQQVQITSTGFEQWKRLGTLENQETSFVVMEALFPNPFFFSGDINMSSRKGLHFADLYENNESIWTLSMEDESESLHVFFFQKDGSIYYGCGWSGYIHRLYRMQADAQMARQMNVFSIHPMRSDVIISAWSTDSSYHEGDDPYCQVRLELQYENQTGGYLILRRDLTRLSKKVGDQWVLLDYEGNKAGVGVANMGSVSHDFSFDAETYGEGLYSMSLFCDIVGEEDLEGIPMAEVVFEIVDPGETTAEGYSYMGNEDELFAPTFTLYGRNQATVTFGIFSSYIFTGTYEVEGDTLILTEDGGYGLRYVFHRQNLEYVFDQEKSSNFLYVDVPDGAVFVRNFGKWFSSVEILE